jgi:acyl-CoA synthetase (NDP forming)
MGVYCPKSRLSFGPKFPRESGRISYISQSGGNAGMLVDTVSERGVRFNKVISYGNACDLNESDFLEYLADDTESEIIAMYIEGVRDGVRFRKAVEKATKNKTLILLKGGVTEEGARATVSHTGSLSGSDKTWRALCTQLNIIRVDTVTELADILVALEFMTVPEGRNVALVGAGGGPSVLVTDHFAKYGLKVPQLPEEIRLKILEYSDVAGNMLRNPVDYGQNMWEAGKFPKTIGLINEWTEIDFITIYLGSGMMPLEVMANLPQIVQELFEVTKNESRPLAMVFMPSIVPDEAVGTFPIIQKLVSLKLPVFYSFTDAASAISKVIQHKEASR